MKKHTKHIGMIICLMIALVGSDLLAQNADTAVPAGAEAAVPQATTHTRTPQSKKKKKKKKKHTSQNASSTTRS